MRYAQQKNKPNQSNASPRRKRPINGWQSKWGKNPATISKWCTNTAQPSLEMLLQIAKVLNVEVKDLLRESDE